MVQLKPREFVKHVDTITQADIDDVLNGTVSVLIVKGAAPEDVDLFGELLPQDLYNSKVVPIGTKNKSEDHVWSTTEMLWHQDRGYNSDIHSFVGLYCIAADSGSATTSFCDMQQVYADLPEDLKIRISNQVCTNSVSKYFKQAEYPHTFRSPTWERAYRMKAKAIHPLVQYDEYGPFLFYSEAYTETEFESDLKSICYNEKYIYEHYWTPGDLAIYNNLKVAHKRGETSADVDRRHLRFAINSK